MHISLLIGVETGNMHGGLALIGGFCIVIAAFLTFLAFQGISYFGSPQTEAVLAVAFFALAALFIFIGYKAVESLFYKVRTGKEALIGSTGVATTELNPKGTVRVMGEFWQATTQNGTIKKGENVQVTKMEGMFLVVKPTQEKT
jgi:membrane-bound ClpP family serine protease